MYWYFCGSYATGITLSGIKDRFWRGNESGTSEFQAQIKIQIVSSIELELDNIFTDKVSGKQIGLNFKNYFDTLERVITCSSIPWTGWPEI